MEIKTVNVKTLSLAFAALLGIASIGVFHTSAQAQDGARSATDTAVYKPDAVHSSVLFRVKHAGVTNFYGRFKHIDGEFSLDPDNPAESFFNFQIETASVETDNEKRNNHLRSPDFFNVRQFPRAQFQSDSVTKTGQDTYEVQGALTLHGQTNPVTATVKHTGTGTFRGNEILGIEARFQIKRADFGMTGFMAPDGSDDGPLGNTVNAIVSVEGIKQ